MKIKQVVGMTTLEKQKNWRKKTKELEKKENLDVDIKNSSSKNAVKTVAEMVSYIQDQLMENKVAKAKTDNETPGKDVKNLAKKIAKKTAHPKQKAKAKARSKGSIFCQSKGRIFCLQGDPQTEPDVHKKCRTAYRGSALKPAFLYDYYIL